MGNCGRWGAAFAALAVVGGVAGRGAAIDPDVAGRPLHAIQFVSDAAIDEDGVRRLLPLRIGEPLTAEAIEDVRRLLELRQTFRRIEIDPIAGPEGVTLWVRLERKRIIDAVRVTGHDAVSNAEMRRLIRLPPGTVMEPELVEAARSRVGAHYRKLGFVDAQVSADVHADRGEVDIEFRIVEGEPLVVSSIMAEGDAVIPPDRVRSVLGKLEGRRWSREVRREAERTLLGELRDAGYYEARVSSSWAPGEQKQGVLRLSVRAGVPFVIDVTGNRQKSRRALLAQLNLRERLLITDGTWRELARRMTRAYQEDGYYRAQVRVEIEDEHPKRVHLLVGEGRRYALRRVEFVGNRLVSRAALGARMTTRAARWFPWPRSGVLLDDVLDEDLKRLWFFYRVQGFEHAEIVDARRTLDDERGTIDLSIVIEEGPRTIVRAVRREGLEMIEEELPVLRASAGRPLNPEDLKSDRRTFLAALGRLGYAEAQVEAAVERRSKGQETEAVVTWSATPGPRQRIGAVIVQGSIATRDRAVLRELPFTSGDPFNPERLLKGQANVYRLGLFRSASVRPLVTRDGSVKDVGVKVAERAPGRLEWGAGFNTRDGLGAFGEAAYDNLGGLARRISLRGQATLDPSNVDDSQFLGTLGFRDPRVAGTVWQLQSNLIGERSTRAVDQFSVTRASLITSLDRELSARTRSGVELQIERSKVFDVKPEAQLTEFDEGLLWTVAPSVFLVYDGRDERLAPRRGVFDSVRVRYALPELSTVHFTKISVQHSQYVPLGGDVVLVSALRGGWGFAFNAGGELPIRERFFLGGRSTVRGFSENSISPHGKTGDPIGGDVAVNLNAEIRFPIAYGFGGAVFVDGGGVYLQDAGDGVCTRFCGVSLDNFRRSAGLGLRYETPIGPVSLDYGVKLDRRAGEDFGEIHFSIGSRF